MNFVRYALWLFLALLAGPLTAAELSGKVVGISDGDTLTLLVPDGASFKSVKVRLGEIDTPESKQPYGERAKQALSDLAFGKPCPDCACSGLWRQQFVQIQPRKKPPWRVSRAASRHHFGRSSASQPVPQNQVSAAWAGGEAEFAMR